MLEKKFQVMAHTALSETSFLANFDDSCFSLLHGFDDFGSGR